VQSEEPKISPDAMTKNGRISLIFTGRSPLPSSSTAVGTWGKQSLSSEVGNWDE